MLKKMKALYARYQDVLLYLIFGALTTVVNYLIYLPCYNLLGLGGAVSNADRKSVV